MKKATDMKKTIVWILILLSLAAGGFYWNRTRTQEIETGPTYQTVTVERQNLRVTVESTGQIDPRNRLDIKSPIAGRLEELLVDEGSQVEKGQILGWISSTERATLLDAALAISQEELKYWQTLYKPTPLVSPLKGTVIARDFEPGQTISSSDSILTIADDLIVVANLDETDIGLIRSGQPVDVTLEAYPDQPFPCEVEKIAYDAKTVSNVTMYDVDVRPLKLPAFARSGMTADLEFIIKQKAHALTLPTAAIQQETAQRPSATSRPAIQPSDLESRKSLMVKHLKEQGLSDTDIQKRLSEFAAKGDKNGLPAGRKTKTGTGKNHNQSASAESVYVLTGSPDNPQKTAVKTGITDGSTVEITEGLKEGESVLIPQVKLSSGKSKKRSLLMSGPGGGGPPR